MASEECSGSFEYSLPFTPSSTYARGDQVLSPTVVVGKCPVGLIIYPRGNAATLEAGKKALSAYVSVRKRGCWPDTWAFPAVRWSIEVQNVEDSKKVATRDTRTFSHEEINCGAHNALPCDGYNELKTGGWVFPDNTVRFHVTLAGASLEHSHGKQQETDCGVQLWQALQFTDMVLCADDEGEGLPCHRAVLAIRSPVFQRMLTSGMQEAEMQRCVIRNVSFEALKAFTEFIYTKFLPEDEALNMDYLRELLVLGNQYEVKDLFMHCTNGLVEIMSPTNACDVFALLGRHLGRYDADERFQQAKDKVLGDHTMVDALVQNYATGAAPADGWTDLEGKAEGELEQHEGPPQD